MKIVEKWLIKKMGYIPFEIHKSQIEAIQTVKNKEIKNLKNQVDNLKKRLKYATEKKYL